MVQKVDRKNEGEIRILTEDIHRYRIMKGKKEIERPIERDIKQRQRDLHRNRDFTHGSREREGDRQRDRDREKESKRDKGIGGEKERTTER